MNRSLTRLSHHYGTALREHLEEAPPGVLGPALQLGRRALAMGLETLDLAKLHECVLASLKPAPRPSGDGIARRAAHFFAEAITPIENNHRAAVEAAARLDAVQRTLTERTEALAAANRELKQEVPRRHAAEKALQKSAAHQTRLLAQSRQMQEQLRELSHQLLLAQEEERKKISRELHDDIAQTLTAINLHLDTLTREASINNKGLKDRIAHTKKLVENSVNVVHRFARELRPTLLDDLGLISALRSLLKGFVKRARVRIRFSVFPGVERLDSDKRTVLYRVAQAALNNVAQHAQASRVKVSIRKIRDAVCMEISDNGKSFAVERVLVAKRNKRLGLLGMRERVQMVGGGFSIKSAPGEGTIIRAEIPFTTRAV